MPESKSLPPRPVAGAVYTYRDADCVCVSSMLYLEGWKCVIVHPVFGHIAISDVDVTSNSRFPLVPQATGKGK